LSSNSPYSILPSQFWRCRETYHLLAVAEESKNSEYSVRSPDVRCRNACHCISPFVSITITPFRVFGAYYVAWLPPPAIGHVQESEDDCQFASDLSTHGFALCWFVEFWLETTAFRASWLNRWPSAATVTGFFVFSVVLAMLSDTFKRKWLAKISFRYRWSSETKISGNFRSLGDRLTPNPPE
jgi:hypothetical protein